MYTIAHIHKIDGYRLDNHIFVGKRVLRISRVNNNRIPHGYTSANCHFADGTEVYFYAVKLHGYSPDKAAPAYRHEALPDGTIVKITEVGPKSYHGRDNVGDIVRLKNTSNECCNGGKGIWINAHDVTTKEWICITDIKVEVVHVP